MNPLNSPLLARPAGSVKVMSTLADPPAGTATGLAPKVTEAPAVEKVGVKVLAPVATAGVCDRSYTSSAPPLFSMVSVRVT